MMGVTICAVCAMTSCKSKESAYKKAYEKAKAEQAAVVTTPTTTTPTTTVTTTPVTTTTPVATTTVTPVAAQDYSNVAVRTESFSMVSGQPLSDYSVVVGSFSVKANAEALAGELSRKGYSPRIIQANTDKGLMYRVVAATYKEKREAAQARASLMDKYVGAWLLYQR